MRGGFLYLVAVMDWSSRYVLSWELSNTMETGFCRPRFTRHFASANPTSGTPISSNPLCITVGPVSNKVVDFARGRC